MKRRLTVLCALLMVLVMLVGCSKAPATTDTTTTTTATKAPAAETKTETKTETSPEEESNLNPAGELPLVKEKVTLTAIQYIRDTDAITISDDFWYVKKCEEETNIHIDYTQINQSDWNQQINLMFASGEYPDFIVNGGSIDAEIYGVDQGILIPLDDIVKEWMPTYYERLMVDTAVWQNLVRSDGKVYAIGKMADYSGDNTGSEFFINKIWLEKLGLNAPTNTTELHDVLTAFVNDDPNGNGKKDEIGYEGIFDELTTWFFSLWGIPENSNHFSINEDKQIVFNPEQPGYREAVEYMAAMYAEGLMDPATMTQDGNSKISMYNTDNVGLTTMHRLRSMGWDCLVESMMHLDPPAAEGYDVKMYTSTSSAVSIVFLTNTNKHIPETARWLDYQMSKQCMFETFYGPEGTLWNWNADGMCELGPAGDQGVMEYSLGVNGIYFMPNWYYKDVFLQPDYRQERMKYAEDYRNAGYLEKYPIAYAKDFASITADVSTQITQIFTNIEALYDQAIADMIMHGVTDAAWDSFIKNLKASGSDEYIALYQGPLDEFFAK